MNEPVAEIVRLWSAKDIELLRDKGKKLIEVKDVKLTVDNLTVILGEEFMAKFSIPQIRTRINYERVLLRKK